MRGFTWPPAGAVGTVLVVPGAGSSSREASAGRGRRASRFRSSNPRRAGGRRPAPRRPAPPPGRPPVRIGLWEPHGSRRRSARERSRRQRQGRERQRHPRPGELFRAGELHRPAGEPRPPRAPVRRVGVLRPCDGEGVRSRGVPVERDERRRAVRDRRDRPDEPHAGGDSGGRGSPGRGRLDELRVHGHRERRRR